MLYKRMVSMLSQEAVSHVESVISVRFSTNSLNSAPRRPVTLGELAMYYVPQERSTCRPGRQRIPSGTSINDGVLGNYAFDVT